MSPATVTLSFVKFEQCRFEQYDNTSATFWILIRIIQRFRPSPEVSIFLHNWQLVLVSETMSFERGGRGRGRGVKFGGRGNYSRESRGLTPTIGAYLDYAPGREANISYIALWSKKIAEYVNTQCDTKVASIFGINGTVGTYYRYTKPKTPQIEEGEVSVTAKMKMKIWELAYTEYTKITVKYEQEKRKVYAIMIGQMSESSKNRVSEISEGAVAMESEDPKGLLAAIIVTHMHDSRLGVMQNLCKAELAYTNTTMYPGETVIHYYQKSVAILASLEQAHKRADNIVDKVMPKEEQRAVRFILGLSSEYASYQQCFRDSLREWPDSLENAFVDASKFTPL